MTPEFWAICGVGLVILWRGGEIVNNIHVAAVERRKDHEELVAILEETRGELGTINLLVDGISNAVDPPPSKYEDPPY